MELIDSWWAYQVRLLPVLSAIGVYAGIQLLRKLSKFLYMPSYFAIFPLSMLQGQLASYFGEDMHGEYLTLKRGRKRSPALFAMALLSIFLTFAIVPIITGFLVAFVLTAQDFKGFLLVLIGAEAIRCGHAAYDFAHYRGNWKPVILYFGSFYAVYLICLFESLRIGFRFSIPFTDRQDYAGLFFALEGQFSGLVLWGLGVGVIGNLFVYYLLNKDTIMPPYAGYEDTNEGSERGHDV